MMLIFLAVLGFWLLCGLVTVAMVRINDHFVYRPYPIPEDFAEALGLSVILGPFGVILGLGALVARFIKDRRKATSKQGEE